MMCDIPVSVTDINMKRSRENAAPNEFFPPMSPPIYAELKEHVGRCWSDLIASLEYYLHANNTVDFVVFHCVTRPVTDLLFRSCLPNPTFWTMAIVILKRRPGHFLLYWSDSIDGVHVDMTIDSAYQLNEEDVTWKMKCVQPLYTEIDYATGNILSEPKDLSTWR